MIPPAAYSEMRPDAADLVEAHMGLVKRLAWMLHGRVGRFVEIEDVMQAGYIGLVEASQRYTPQEEVPFSAYAAPRIRGAILDSLRRNSNLSRRTVAMRQAVRRTQDKLAHKLGRAPEPAEIAQALKLSLSELQEWESRFAVNELQSLDEVYTDHSLVFRDDAHDAERSIEITELKSLLREAIEELPERQALVLQLCYVEEFNIYEMAATLDVTPGRVSQIKKSALIRLRDLMDSKTGS